MVLAVAIFKLQRLTSLIRNAAAATELDSLICVALLHVGCNRGQLLAVRLTMLRELDGVKADRIIHYKPVFRHFQIICATPSQLAPTRQSTRSAEIALAAAASTRIDTASD